MLRTPRANLLRGVHAFMSVLSKLLSVEGEFRYKNSENVVAERLWVPKKKST